MTKRITDEELREIEQRAERATKGPWGVERSLDEADVYEIVESSVFLSPIVAETRFLADAEFIAHAREDIPRLIAEVRRLRDIALKLNEELREVKEKYLWDRSLNFEDDRKENNKKYEANRKLILGGDDDDDK